MSDWVKVGEISVDAGCVLVSDPCYVLPDKNYPTKRSGTDYSVVFGKTDADYNIPVIDLAERGADGALLLQNFGGDGTFEVFGKVVNGNLKAVYIDFEGNADEDIPVETAYSLDDESDDYDTDEDVYCGHEECDMEPCVWGGEHPDE